MPSLDDLKSLQKIDRSNVKKFLINFPQEIKKSLKKAQKIKIYKNYQNIVFVGMGGSAIGGEIVSNFLKSELKIPSQVVRDFNLPEYINQKTLIFLISYSGNTEEVIKCYKIAKEKKAKIFILTYNGQLEKLAKKEKDPILKIELKAPPRFALSWLCFPLLSIITNKKFYKEINELIHFLKEFNKELNPLVKSENNPSKYLAYRLYDHIPLIFGAQHLKPVAKRFKTQLNENAKNFAFFEEIPEIFHNSVEGLSFPWREKDEIFFLILDSNFYPKEIKKRIKILIDIFEKKNLIYENIPALGNNKLEEIFSLILLLDWTSFYLSILNEIDPQPVPTIELIKKLSYK